MVSAITPSANEPALDLNLVHTVQLKPMIKVYFSGRMVSSGISDVAFVSLHSEKKTSEEVDSIIIIIIIMKRIARISGFCQAADVDFQRLVEPR